MLNKRDSDDKECLILGGIFDRGNAILEFFMAVMMLYSARTLQLFRAASL